MTQRSKSVLPKTRTKGEWVAFFGVIDTRYPTQARNHALLSLMYATGLRVGESLALKVRDVDFELGKLTVTEGKTGMCTVPLPQDMDALKATLDRWLGCRSAWHPQSDLLFITSAGWPMRASAVRRSMALYGERAGIGHVTPHMLRHSCATELLANGASPIGVQRVLGHARLSTTLDVYASAADSHAAEAMSKR